jgi:hypothetical protein
VVTGGWVVAVAVAVGEANVVRGGSAVGSSFEHDARPRAKAAQATSTATDGALARTRRVGGTLSTPTLVPPMR